MAVFRALLVPVDGSDQSNAATELAIRIADDQKAFVTFVNVVEVEKIIASIIPGNKFADPTPVIEQLRAAIAEILREAIAKAQEAGVQAHSQMAEGDCVEMVVELAKTTGSDLIVLGSHGRSGLERFILGSVAQGLVRKSQVPVLVAKLRPA